MHIFSLTTTPIIYFDPFTIYKQNKTPLTLEFPFLRWTDTSLIFPSPLGLLFFFLLSTLFFVVESLRTHIITPEDEGVPIHTMCLNIRSNVLCILCTICSINYLTSAHCPLAGHFIWYMFASECVNACRRYRELPFLCLELLVRKLSDLIYCFFFLFLCIVCV